MPSLTLTWADSANDRIVDAVKGLYTIPQIPDPRNPPGPDVEPDVPMVNKFTDEDWIEERCMRFLRDTVARWEQVNVERPVPPPEDIVTRSGR